MHSGSLNVQRTDTTPLIDCIRRFSVSDNKFDERSKFSWKVKKFVLKGCNHDLQSNLFFAGRCVRATKLAGGALHPAWGVHVLKEIKSVRTRSVLGAIACPPSFLNVHSDQHTVHLIYYLPDRLCRWNPSQPFLRSLKCRYTVVDGHFDLYSQHFGKHDHNYSHWLRLQLGCGTFSLPHLMMRYDGYDLWQAINVAIGS